MYSQLEIIDDGIGHMLWSGGDKCAYKIQGKKEEEADCVGARRYFKSLLTGLIRDYSSLNSL